MKKTILLIPFFALVTCSVVLAFADDKPIIRWDFREEETSRLQAVGGVQRDVPGPRAPEYPDFEANNHAVKFDGQGAHYVFDDPGPNSEFDFTTGDAITLEAWVQVEELRKNEHVYVISKGRTGNPGFAADNQNWALRIKENKEKGCVSFLFATPRESGSTAPDSHWHRWTSDDGFKPGKLWHHIAVSYRFGEPTSIQCWIDGKAKPGKWDMGGATTQAPVVDDDAIWIGSSRGGAAANSFRGSMDAIAIHRQAIADSVMKLRYKSTAVEKVAKPLPETMPDIQDLPRGKVLLSLHEGMPSHTRWLQEGESFPEETLRLPLDHFLLDRLPQRFDTWGIRANWKEPVLLRFTADVDWKPEYQKLLTRVRGLSRLWVDGQLIARGKPIPGSPSGEEPMTPIALPPSPGMRIAEHRQQELFGQVDFTEARRCRVVLEMVLGGKGFRTDPGETCVAVQLASDGPFVLLKPADAAESMVMLTDAEVEAALQRLESDLQSTDMQRRRELAESQNQYWKKRHEIARSTVQQIDIPNVSTGDSEKRHPVDAFLAEKIRLAKEAASHSNDAEARDFHERVLPVLKSSCIRCHGEKEQGGLRLDTRETALKAGDSDSLAIVPGHADASELIRRITSEDSDERMPPGGIPLAPDKIAILRDWINAGAKWPAPILTPELVTPSAMLKDESFLRRVFYDTIGLPPTADEVRAFVEDPSQDKHVRIVDRLLEDPRWADHWMSYWQDVLAENPTLINSSLNTTGPFRWFLYDALQDNKPVDRMVTELILMRGSPHEGGSAGFGLAGDNDAPMAAKAQIIASAFLGMEMQCARCHDAPYHSISQSDLYSMAAMLSQKAITVPKTSRVPAAFFENKARESLIKVTLKHDSPVGPSWPFASQLSDGGRSIPELLLDPADSREQLAAYVTSPSNKRFAHVLVNRVWRLFMGAGFVEPPHDWEGNAPSHPELMQWLANDFVAHGYSLKRLSRWILTSEAYARAATGTNLRREPELRFFAAPDPRRLTAEQIVDTLVATSGRPMDVEELTFDPDARRASSNRLTLGVPRRAWMFADLANERDRPSLNLPRAQGIADILLAFGWSGARQNPRTDRETAPNALQPGVLANSAASLLFTRAADRSELARLAVEAQSPETLVEALFLRYLGRLPRAEEKQAMSSLLSVGFASRLMEKEKVEEPTPLAKLQRVTWSNHLRSEANEISLELERRARGGPSADPRLDPQWREVYEDALWTLINTREFVWLP